MMTTTFSQLLSAITPAVAPELASWSLMILGFAMVGQMLRMARGLA